MNWVSCWVSLTFQRTGSHTVQLWRSFNLSLGASRALCYGMSASRFSTLESTSLVVCVQGRRCVCCYWETARAGTRGHSRLALVSGFLWSCARPLRSCFILGPVLDPSLFSKRPVKIDSLYCHRSPKLRDITEKKFDNLQLIIQLYFWWKFTFLMVFQEILTDWRLCHF